MAQLPPPSFLHFTSWTPENLVPGQRIRVGSEESNYWRQKLSHEWAKAPAQEAHQQAEQIVRAIEQYAIRDPALGPAYRTIQRAAETFSGIAVDYRFRAELLKEYIFERVRREVDDGLPSRWRCMFLFDDSLDTETYLATMPGLAQVRPTLIRVRPSAGARWHRARVSLLNCNTRSPSEIEQRAREYWIASPEPQVDSEVLLVGEVEIVEVLSPRTIPRSFTRNVAR